MSDQEEAPTNADAASRPSRCYLWFRSWFSWSAWYRWMHGLKDCELNVAEKDKDKRCFLVMAVTPHEALQALIVPRLGDKYLVRDEVCVDLNAEVWLPDFLWKVTATYR